MSPRNFASDAYTFSTFMLALSHVSGKGGSHYKVVFVINML